MVRMVLVSNPSIDYQNWDSSKPLFASFVRSRLGRSTIRVRNHEVTLIDSTGMYDDTGSEIDF